MIIKGGSRANPTQLARHLMREDQNEIVRVVQCDSSPTGNLRDAFSDMQLLTIGTKGTKGLYHAQINPDARYDMTPEQWTRAANVLEEELGFQGQPRTVVLHQKKGRPHLHVVWARTDLKTMTLRSDSNNYISHERASDRLEREFGHEPTPGAHVKRDPTKERPTTAFNHAAWQQSERSQLDPRDLKQSLTDLYHQCDTGQAFKAALEHHGYQLTTGKRAFVIVDPTGGTHSLSRQIQRVRAAEIREKFSDLDPESLPTVEAAKQDLPAAPREPDQPIELPRPLPDFNKAAGKATPNPLTLDPEDIRARERERLEAERRSFDARQEAAYRQQEAHWASERKESLKRFDANFQQRLTEMETERFRPPSDPLEFIQRYWQLIQDRLNPQRAIDRATERRQHQEALFRSEHASHSRSLTTWEQGQRVAFRERQAQQATEFQARIDEQIDRLNIESDRYRQQLARDREQETQRDKSKGLDRDREPPPATSRIPPQYSLKMAFNRATRPRLSAIFNALARVITRALRPSFPGRNRRRTPRGFPGLG